MMISSNCKKLMAFVLTIAMVLSVLFIPKAPSASAAAEDQPSVTVLGATIRLDPTKDYDNNGKQSMMIGIRVDNANKASACAIRLTSGSRSYTIATDAAKYAGESGATQTTLHSKDLTTNSIVYAVVITNIPEANYYSTISILGKVWDMGGNLYTSDTAEKNVMGVVDTIKSKYPGLNICILNGSLYKDAGTSKLSAIDISGYSEDPDPEMTSNPLSTPAPTRAPAGENEWAVPFERINENSEGDIFYAPVDPSHQSCARTYDRYDDELLISNETTDSFADGLTVNLPAEEIAKRYTKITINYEYVGSGSGVFGFKYRNPAGSEAFANNDSFKLSRSETSKVINIDSNYMPVSKFYMITFSTGISIRVKSIIFSDPKPDCSGDSDLSTTTVDNIPIAESTVASLNEGVITVNDSEGSTELLFDLPNNGTIDNGETVAVAIEGTVTVPDFVGFRVRLAHGSNNGDSSWSSNFTSTQSRAFKEVFTLTATAATATKIAVKSISANGDPISGLTISKVSVYWTGRDAVAPTAMPSPTPTPVPTPVPTAVPNADFFAVQVPSGSSITVDGNIDSTWNNAIEYPFVYYSNGWVRNTSIATIKLMWDEDDLYGIYDIHDPVIDESHKDEWNRDGIEIFFDEDNSKESKYGGGSDPNTDAFQYRVSGLATNVASPLTKGFSHNTSATADLYSGLTAVSKGYGAGYVVEFKIPLVNKAVVNRVVGFDATVMDAESEKRNNELWFTSIKTGDGLYGDASQFENVKFIASKPSTPINSPNPADPADCLAHFTFDDDTLDGKVYRSLDGNAKAYILGSVNSTTNAMDGKAINIDPSGNPGLLSVKNADGSSILDGKDAVTISYWSRVTKAYDNNAINYGWAFYAGRHGINLGTNNRYYFALYDRFAEYRLDRGRDDGTGNDVVNTTSYEKINGTKTGNVWNNITVVADGKNATVYVNGVANETTITNGLVLSKLLGSNSDFYIGTRPFGAYYEYFNGTIDDFAIFDRAFTPSEVAAYVGAVVVPTPAPTPTPTPAPDWYKKISSLSELQNNDNVLIIYSGKNKILMPIIANGNNSDTGFRLDNFTTDGTGNILGDHSSQAWTFVQDGSNWKLKYGGNYAVLSRSSVSFNSSGSSFTIGASNSKYTFSTGSNVFNDFYNSGNIISGWYDGTIEFDLYRYNGKYSN